MKNPIYLNYYDTNATVIGDNEFAKKAVKQLLYYGSNVRLIAKELPQELKGLKNLTLDSRDYNKVWPHVEDFVVIATDDHELNVYLASLFKYYQPKALIITQEPTLFTNAELPDVNNSDVGLFLKENLHEKENQWPYMKVLDSYDHFKINKEDESIDNPHLIKQGTLTIGIPEKSKNIDVDETLNAFKTAFPFLNFEIVKLQNIKCHKSWDINNKREDGYEILNNSADVAFDNLLNKKVDLVLLEGEELPKKIPEELQLISGFTKPKNNRISMIYPYGEEDTMYDLTLNRISYFINRAQELNYFNDFKIANDMDLEEILELTNGKSIDEEQQKNLKSFIEENNNSIFFIPEFLLEEQKITIEYLLKNGLAKYQHDISPIPLQGTTVALVTADKSGKEIYDSLQSIINKDLELATILEHYFRSKIVEYDEIIKYDEFAGGFLYDEDKVKFKGFVISQSYEKFSEETEYEDDIFYTIDSLFKLLEDSLNYIDYYHDDL